MDTAFDGVDEIKISDQKVGEKLHVNLVKKSEDKDSKTGKIIHKYDIKNFCNGGLNTAKTYRILDITPDDLSD